MDEVKKQKILETIKLAIGFGFGIAGIWEIAVPFSEAETMKYLMLASGFLMGSGLSRLRAIFGFLTGK